MRKERDAERAVRKSAGAKMVRQDQLVRTLVDLSRLERGEVGLRVESEAFWATLEGLPLVER